MAVYYPCEGFGVSDHRISDGELQADDLTWREQEILTLLAERMTNREIANRLHLAESTVKDYVGKILSKLYVKNRREAVVRAKALDLLDSSKRVVNLPQTSLPTEPTQFVGRINELAEIRHCLGETRLLTLIGPGGIGKTRLALKAAREISSNFDDGSFFISLAPIHSAESIVQTIAEAVKFPLATQETPQSQLIRYLSKKKILLVMDNFEHLLDGIDIVSEILQTALDVKILVTSRERLNLQSETVLSVGGMGFLGQKDALVSTNNDAITLFIQSANKVRPGFDPCPDDLEQIIKICQLVQGMPLAIELAAAWLSILNVAEVASELGKGLDILETGIRDTPERHRSIRAVFEHSWFLLDRFEQEILMILSVFRGGFTRDAAQWVAGATLQHLSGFVNKSLLSLNPDTGRLEIHELLRQFAQERLGKVPEANIAAHEAHAVYFGEFMQRMWADLRSSRQMLALAEIEEDIQNVRTAWRYYLGQKNIAQLWKFINGIWYLYWVRWWNHAGMDLFAEAVRALEEQGDGELKALRALAMSFQAYFMAWLDLADQGYQLAKEGVATLEELNHPEALALAYDCLGVNAFFLSRYTEEIEASNQMRKIASESDDKWLLAFSYFAVSMGALLQADYTEARWLAESNLKICEQIGDEIGSTQALIVLGHAAFAQKEFEAASGFYLRCLELSQESGFYYGIQTASKYLGKVALSSDDIPEAKKYLLQSLTITKEIGFVRDIINLLYEFARLQVAQGDLEGAAELLTLVIAHPASNLYRMLEGRIRDSARELLVKLESQLPQDIYTTAQERGRNLDLDEMTDNLLAMPI